MSDVLMTDLYEVTMTLSYLREGMTAPATFSLFVRDLPPDRGFLVAAGLETALHYLDRFHVTDEDVEVLADMLGRDRTELEVLRGIQFTGDVWAVPEGRIVLANEPLLEITAPLPQAQLVETFLLNQISHQTSLASKAARCYLAARGRPVVDFGLRRTHGIEAGMHAARAGGIAGFVATSNVAAARVYGIPATGTMAHSYVEAFGDERAAFAAYASSTTGPITLLVDTYDTERGVHRAAEVLKLLEPPYHGGVRLDSGNLARLAVAARRSLDAAGLNSARIVASGGLDEYAIDDLVRADAPIDVFAVGTKVGTSADAPYLDSAYKLVEYGRRPVLKLSEGKMTTPGAKQVFRRADMADQIGLRSEALPIGVEPLLHNVMPEDYHRPAHESIAAAHMRFVADLDKLPAAARRIRNPIAPTVQTTNRLADLTDQLRSRLL